MSNRAPRVLFIDDSTATTDICQVVLEDLNYEIKAEPTAERGIKTALSFKPDVIFLDMVLPDLDGIAVAKRIFSGFGGQNRKPVIYAFTNYKPDYFGSELAEAGIKGCISKFVDLKQLKLGLSGAVSDAVATGPSVRPESYIKLLLIEDNPADVQLFELLMSEVKVPYAIEVVPDGEAATQYMFEKVAQGLAPVPDLIFLDLNLPKKDGKQVLREFKNKPIFRQIPILVLTTSKNQDDVRSCYELHANCFLTKPTDLIDFKQIVKQVEDFWLKLVRLPGVTMQQSS